MAEPSRPPSRLGAAAATVTLALALSAVMGRPRDRAPATGGRSGRGGPPGATSDPHPHAAATEPGRGRQAGSPEKIPARGWWDIMWRVYGEIGEDRIFAVAAGVTFYGLLAVFPAIGAFVSLYGLVADPGTIGEHLADLSGLLPGGALEIVGEQVKRITSNSEAALGFAFFSGLAVALWSANAGMKAVFDALNVAYEEDEKRNFVVLNAVSLAFTFGAILFLVIALASVVVVPIVLNFFGLGGIAEWLIWIGRWPALLLILLLGLGLLYRYGPSRDLARWRWLAPGSLFAAIGWMAASMLFSWYVGAFANYNETYGSLGAAIGFMTWMWISTMVILVGAELNAEIEHQTARDTTTGPEQPLGTRGARMADQVGAARA